MVCFEYMGKVYRSRDTNQGLVIGKAVQQQPTRLVQPLNVDRSLLFVTDPAVDVSACDTRPAAWG